MENPETETNQDPAGERERDPEKTDKDQNRDPETKRNQDPGREGDRASESETDPEIQREA